MEIPEKYLARQLSQVLGKTLSEHEVSNYLKKIVALEPSVGQLFWDSTEAIPGIYLVIEGKVRLLDPADNLVISLEPGSSFGELTLFAGENFQRCKARASMNLKLYYLDGECLQSLIHKYPVIKEHLYRRASELDSLLLHRDELPQQGVQPTESYSFDKLNGFRSLSPAKIIASKPQREAIAYFPKPTVKVGQWWQHSSGRYPFYKQHSATDCGVACLVMIGRYWGKRFSINRLRALANVSRDGASLRGLVTAAESMGFAPRPVQAELKSLTAQNLPAIAHWEGNHYVVVYKMTRDRVLMSDPAIGRRVLTRKEFLKGWAGYTLLLQPTAFLNDALEAQHNFWKFFELLKPHWSILLEILLASLAIQIFGLVTPLLTQILLDRVVIERSTTTLIAIAIGLLIFSLFQIVVRSLRRYLIYHTANRIDLSLIVGFISHTLKLPLSYFESRYVGDITSRIEENRKIRRFLTGDALTLSLDLLTVFVYIGLMLWYSWQMTLLALVIVPFFVLLALFATPFLKRISREIFQAKTIESSYLIEALTGIGTIKSMGIERTVRWHWEELFNKSVKVNFSGQILREKLNFSSSIVETMLARILLIFGVWQVIQEQLTIGQLIAFNMLLGNVISPFKRLTDLWNEFQEIVIAVERIDDVIQAPPEEDLQQLSIRPTLPSLQGHIRFDRVTFRYSPESDTNTLENLSFEVKPGQTVAIVGRSGSGKTTIAKLILGLYLPVAGKISIDGYETSNVALHSLRQQIGVVDQNTFLFGGTIRENISIARPGATMEEIREAARLAGAEEFIDALPLKYETRIGEGGGLLSGGQRQRLAIARALLGKPRLLLLDEATSARRQKAEGRGQKEKCLWQKL